MAVVHELSVFGSPLSVAAGLTIARGLPLLRAFALPAPERERAPRAPPARC